MPFVSILHLISNTGDCGFCYDTSMIVTTRLLSNRSFQSPMPVPLMLVAITIGLT